MIRFLGCLEYKDGHVFVEKNGRCWQRVWEDHAKRWASIPNSAICVCCAGAEIKQRMEDLGLTFENDGLNPPSEEEWNSVIGNIPNERRATQPA